MKIHLIFLTSPQSEHYYDQCYITDEESELQKEDDIF